MFLLIVTIIKVGFYVSIVIMNRAYLYKIINIVPDFRIEKYLIVLFKPIEQFNSSLISLFLNFASPIIEENHKGLTFFLIIT